MNLTTFVFLYFNQEFCEQHDLHQSHCLLMLLSLQLDAPQKTYSVQDVVWYGLRWIFSLMLMETMTHFFYYNAFAIK